MRAGTYICVRTYCYKNQAPADIHKIKEKEKE